MFFHRWVALRHNVPSPAVIFTRTFIISLGFANTVPTIPSGLHIAIFCFVLGIITVIFPATFWWTSLLMILYIGASIGLDVYHGWQLKKQNEAPNTGASVFKEYSDYDGLGLASVDC